MGYRRLDHADLVAIGRAASRLYREKHGEKPPKHTQFVDGAARQVSSYFESDRDVLEAAVTSVMQP